MNVVGKLLPNNDNVKVCMDNFLVGLVAGMRNATVIISPDAENIACLKVRQAGFRGAIIVSEKDSNLRKHIKNHWMTNHRQMTPPLYVGSADDAAEGANVPVGVWYSETNLFYSDVLKQLQSICEESTVVGKSRIGTTFIFSFIACAGTTLLRTLNDERRQAAMLSCQAYTRDPTSYLNDTVQLLIERLEVIHQRCGLRLNEGGQQKDFGSFSEVDGVYDSWSNPDVPINAFIFGKHATWTPIEPSSLTGVVCFNVRRAAPASISITEADDNQRSPSPFFTVPRALQTNTCIIHWNGNVFGETVGTCHLQEDIKLREITSTKRFETLAQYLTIIHYLHFRLQTMDTTLNALPGSRCIRYPFRELGHMFKDAHRTLLYKPEQSRKTPLCVALAWVYVFVRGFNVAVALRSVGARHTGIVGFATKGIKSINDTIRAFVEDIRPQLARNGWDAEETIKNLSLSVKTDEEVKWGKNNALKNTRCVDPRREEQKVLEANGIVNTPGVVLCFPLNVTGIAFFSDLMLKINRIGETCLFVDEADETVSSMDRSATLIEQSMFPNGVRALEHPVTENDEEYVDNEEERAAYRLLFTANNICAIPHVFSITASPLPILFANQECPFYFVEMDVSSNYIGIDTPDYCTSSITFEAIDSTQCSANKDLSPEKWWDMEKRALVRIFNDWSHSRKPEALLMVTSGTTSRIVKQESGAVAICSNVNFPLVCIVNNGNSTRFYLTSHFRHLREDVELLKTDFQQLVRNLDEGFMIRNEDGIEFVVDEDIDVDAIQFPSNFSIVNSQGERYARRHPSVIMEFVKALFTVSKIHDPCRCVFLETNAIAQREKSYCSFDRTYSLRYMYFNFPAGGNSSSHKQTAGRLHGISFDEGNTRIRRLYAPEPLYNEIRLHIRMIKVVIALYRSLGGGKTISEINDSIHMGANRYSSEQKDIWTLFMRTYQGPSQTLTFTKKHHQTQARAVIQSLKSVPGPKRRRITPPDAFEESLDTPIINEFILEVIKNVPPRRRDEDDYLAWFCEGLDACHHTENANRQIAQLWYLLLSPWFQYLAPNMDSVVTCPPTGLLAGLVFIRSAGNRLSRAHFNEMCAKLSLAPETLIKPHRRQGNIGQYVVQITDEDDVKLDQAWTFCLPVDGNALRPPVIDENCDIDEDFLRTLVDEDVTMLLTEFWRIITEVAPLSETSTRDKDYPRRFYTDLETAASLSWKDWETMELEAGTNGKTWWLLCAMFIDNGTVLQRSRPITKADWSDWKKAGKINSSRRFDEHLCNYRPYDKARSGGHTWRCKFGYKHLIRHSDNSYEIAIPRGK